MRTLLVSSKLEQNKGDKMFVVLKQKKSKRRRIYLSESCSRDN